MKNKINKKTGFTLAEMLIAMAIVGVSIVVAMTTIQSPKDAALKYLYINAYTSLAKAYYNGTLIGYNPFADDIDGAEAIHEESNDTGTLVLCKGLTYYINTNTNEKTSDHDYSSTCRSNNFSTYMANDSDFGSGKVMFTATNGMRFFITNRLGGGQDENGKDQPYFYIVYVDVNGLNGPNSLGDNYSPKNGEVRSMVPDIFAFAILDTGRVCPLGMPEYDKDILTARFIYGAQGESISPRAFAYYQAKGAAWGFYGSGSLAQDPMTEYNTSEPYSMNDKIRDMIKDMSNDQSKITKNFPDLWHEDPEDLATVSGEIHYDCSNEDLESCYIFLDEYKR